MIKRRKKRGPRRPRTRPEDNKEADNEKKEEQFEKEDKEEIKAFNTLKYLLIYGDRQELIGKDANQLLEHAKKRIQAANNRELIMKSFQQ